tara:strand:+ start:2470 stop:2688 length:219 start_codon:yes stop_codon:yes gene_type:complete
MIKSYAGKKYKAKASYKNAEVNFQTLGSNTKHSQALNGLEIHLNEVPKELENHLEQVVANKPKTKTTKTEEK